MTERKRVEVRRFAEVRVDDGLRLVLFPEDDGAVGNHAELWLFVGDEGGFLRTLDWGSVSVSREAPYDFMPDEGLVDEMAEALARSVARDGEGTS